MLLSAVLPLSCGLGPAATGAQVFVLLQCRCVSAMYVVFRCRLRPELGTRPLNALLRSSRGKKKKNGLLGWRVTRMERGIETVGLAVGPRTIEIKREERERSALLW